MANTTNFGWETPDDTDLVKDGAAAMRTLGNAIDASLVDLKGGTSGQILSKNSNTDMDFVWIANDQGDITGVTAGTGLSGGGTSGSVTLTNTVATTFDAAGDLLVGTGADTWKKLSIGTAGQVLKVNSGATDLEWGASSAGGFVGAYAYKSTGGGSQSISNTTFTVITFDSELFDTDGFHSTTTNTSRMTIPSGKAGKYLIVGRGTFANNATGNRGVRILKNGTLIGEIQTWNAGATYGSSVEITQIADLTVGDYVELASFQASGGSLNTQNGADYYDALMIQYLGA